jgi:hypothetical protein
MDGASSGQPRRLSMKFVLLVILLLVALFLLFKFVLPAMRNR